MDRRLLIAAGLCALAGRPAAAHAILSRSEPGAGTVVPAGELVVRLAFNSRIDATRSRVMLTGPDGKAATLAVVAGAGPNMLEAPARVTAGAWVVRWQVLAVDGHFTRGEFRFSVRAG